MTKHKKHLFILEALKEDRVDNDITSLAIFGKKKTEVTGFLVAKQNLVLSGIDIARDVFHAVSSKVNFISEYHNGAHIKKGERIAKVVGSVADILRAERVALNFLQHLSGVATLTNQFVEKIKPYSSAILDTRKTIPGLRDLEKRAVVHGGGKNHRMNLSDQFLIKDNHIAACGSVSKAIQKIVGAALALPSNNRPLIEVEVTNLIQLREALAEKPDIILLDNMTIAQIKQAVKLVRVGAHGRAPLLEVSGGVNLNTVRKIASTGVDRISIGCLTHSVSAVDISLEIL